LCFVFWDRLMGTETENYEPTYLKIKQGEHG
jgi:sterol desaturase/sphingolipid hydroxylase (fatty acid hydroxylase superfamily)